jgi:RimJ/RimL family protein N-acetyltransferase
LVVETAYRRQGVGTKLIEAWEKTADTVKLFTSTNESNLSMQRLCERLGYVRSGFIENLDEGDPEVIYFKVNMQSARRERPRAPAPRRVVTDPRRVPIAGGTAA